MTPDQIIELRTTLNNIVGELDCFDYREPTPPESSCLKHAKKALALLPCPTCNGSEIKKPDDGCGKCLAGDGNCRADCPCPDCE